MTYYEEYLKALTESFRSHLLESLGNVINLLLFTLTLSIVVLVVIIIYKKVYIRKLYNKIYDDLCKFHNLSPEEKSKLYTISRLIKIKHPLFLMIQPKKWQTQLTDPSSLFLYKKLFE
jgi:hypothetical protein